MTTTNADLNNVYDFADYINMSRMKVVHCFYCNLIFGWEERRGFRGDCNLMQERRAIRSLQLGVC